MNYEEIIKNVKQCMNKRYVIGGRIGDSRNDWQIFVQYVYGDDIVPWEFLRYYIEEQLYVQIRKISQQEKCELWQTAVEDLTLIKQEDYLKALGIEEDSEEYYNTY